MRLEPIDPARHGTGLFAASHGEGADPELWRYMPYGPFADPQAFDQWVSGWAATGDPFFYAVIDSDTAEAGGMASFMRIEPAHGCTEIGGIWFGAALQRSAAATEAIYLLIEHAFDGLGNRRLEWKCNAANARSRRAAERFGFTFEGIFRQHMVVKGENRDTAWFALLDSEWPAVRAAFRAWLAPENLDPDGRQIRALQELRASALR